MKKPTSKGFLAVILYALCTLSIMNLVVVENAVSKQHGKSVTGPPLGYVRYPRIPTTGDPGPDDNHLHIIFSSECNAFQQWQSEVLLASAKMVNQRGRITRIVSGCYGEDAVSDRQHLTRPKGELDEKTPFRLLNRSVNEDFGLFITPSFEGAMEFPWINKPYGIHYFMQHAKAELEKAGETVVAILDPDFIFLKPLTMFNNDTSEIIVTRFAQRDKTNPAQLDRPLPGRPVGQRYGLEGNWVETFNVSRIAGSKSPALKWDKPLARRYTSVGPPLLLDIQDLADLVPLWRKFMRPVLLQETHILADMWAYSIAAAHVGLRHTQLDHFMISHPGISGEAYPFVDAWPRNMSCRAPVMHSPIPVFIHMATTFNSPDRIIGPWMFHKGFIPANIFDCDSPLLKQPPDSMYSLVAENTKDTKVIQSAWLHCQTLFKINQVLVAYKQKFCFEFEARKVLRLGQQYGGKCKRHQANSKWCFDMAAAEYSDSDDEAIIRKVLQ